MNGMGFPLDDSYYEPHPKPTPKPQPQTEDQENKMTTAYRAHYNGRTVTVTKSDLHEGRPWALVNRYGRTVYLRDEWVEIIHRADAEETEAAIRAEALSEKHVREAAKQKQDHAKARAFEKAAYIDALATELRSWNRSISSLTAQKEN